MAFGSDSFPLGPNGQFPRQRIYSAGNEIADPEEMEGLYGMSEVAKLPVVECDFHSSLDRVKGKMKQGRMMRMGQDEDKFIPRYALEGEDDGLGKSWRKKFKKLKRMKKFAIFGAAGAILPKKLGMNMVKTGTKVVAPASMLLGLGEIGLSGYTSSGRKIARTWRYGRNKYYVTIRGGDGRVESGQFVGGGATRVIDYT